MQKAVQELDEAYAGMLRLLGAEHPTTLATQSNLARAYYDAGFVVDSIPLYKEALVAAKRTMGREHPNTLIVSNNLDCAVEDMRRWKRKDAVLKKKRQSARRQRKL